MKSLAIAFTGPSGSGKTTLIEKISLKLTPKYNVSIIKHDPSNKATFDTKGKDSYRFFQTGANVAIVSNEKTAIFKHKSSNMSELISYLKPFDILMVEGLKNWSLPRIGVFRNKIEKEYLPYLTAIAVDNSIDKEEIKDLDVDILDLNNIDMIIEYIFKHSKKV